MTKIPTTSEALTAQMKAYEEETGEPLSDQAKEFIHLLTKMNNQAYIRGLKDARKALSAQRE